MTFCRKRDDGKGLLDANDDNHNIRSKGKEDNREDNEDNNEDNEDKDALVLNAIARNPQLTVRQLAAILPISKATVERVLKSLQNKGRLRRLGGTRGHWEVLK